MAPTQALNLVSDTHIQFALPTTSLCQNEDTYRDNSTRDKKKALHSNHNKTMRILDSFYRDDVALWNE
jgi:hypothetical protein